MNRNRAMKVAALATAAAVTVSSVGYYEFRSSETEVSAADTSEIQQKIEDSLDNVISTSTTTGQDKEETVYIISDAEGNVQKKIVSDWLKNKNSADTITDKTDLKDIENVKGNEDYTEGSDGEITWNADGSDIYYQGTTDKELPVDVKVTYYLDGNEIKASDLAGKSGKVKIRFDYTNNSKKSVTVSGKNTEMYVPFTMISGMMLPTDTFTNVTISDGNGKLITEGKSTIAVGVSFPGLKDDLNLASLSDKVNSNISDCFEITADVTDFSLAMTLTAGTSEVFSSLNPDAFDSIDDISDTVDELVDAVGQLKDGSLDLKSGLGKLKDGSTKVNDGVGTLNSKTGEFVNGLKTLDDGVALMLSKMSGDDGAIAGAEALAKGTKTIDDKIKDVQTGVGKLSDGAETIDKYAGDIADGVGKLSDGADTLDGGLAKLQTGTKTLAKKTKTLDDGMQSLQEGANTLSESTEKLDGYMQDAVKGSKDLYGYLKQLNKAISSASTGASAISSGINSLVTMVTDFDGKGTSMKSVFTQLAAGSQQLADGTAAVQGGLAQLNTGVTAGVDQLQNSMTAQLQAQIDQSNEQITQLKAVLAVTTDPTQAATYQQQIVALSGAVQALQGVVASLTTSSEDPANPSAADGFNQLKSTVNAQLASEGTEDNPTIYDGMNQLNAGANALNDNLQAISNGLNKKIDDDKIAELQKGAGDLSDGLDEMNTKTGEIVKGSKKLYNSLDSLQTDGTSVLDSAVKQLATDEKKGVPALKSGTALLASTLNTLATDKESGVPALKSGSGKLAKNLAKLDGKMGDFTDGTGTLSENLSLLDKQLPALKEGTNQAATGMSTLLTGLTTLSETVGTQMKPGIDSLYSGGLTLQSSIGTLYDATQQILNGVVSAEDGSGKLADGIGQLKEEAIDPISDAVDGDLENDVDRIQQTIKLADDYKIYSDAAADKDTSVKFIYKTDGIESEE